MMETVESNVKIRTVTQPTLEDQLTIALAKKKPKVVDLEIDASGSVLIDKDKHPDIYDWAMNG